MWKGEPLERLPQGEYEERELINDSLPEYKRLCPLSQWVWGERPNNLVPVMHNTRIQPRPRPAPERSGSLVG